MRATVAILILANLVLGQPPITLNTKLRDHVGLASTSWVAGNWGYENATDRYLVQTKGSGGFSVVRTTDPTNIVLTSQIGGSTTPGGISVKEVKVWNNYAYASTDSGPTIVLDLTNPNAVTVAGTFPVGTHTLQIQGDWLFLNRASQGKMEIRNLAANPLFPPLLGQYPSGTTTTGVHDCAPEGNIVYLWGASSGSTKILDVTNPASIALLGTVSAPGYNHSGDLYVTPTGQRILLSLQEGGGGHVRIWNVTNPAAPVYLTNYVASPTASVHNCYIKGAYAYISYYVDGLRVLDLTNPAAPVEIGIFDPNPNNVGGQLYSGAWDVYPYHDAVYMDEMYNTAAPGTQGAYAIDFYPAFGVGSPGTLGIEPEAWWSFGPPSPGNARFALRLTNAAPNVLGYLAIGTSTTTWNGIALPWTIPGAVGSTLYVSADLLIPVTTNPSGEVVVPIPIPTTLSGTYYCQWLLYDAGSPNPGGIAMTKAGKLVVE